MTMDHNSANGSTLREEFGAKAIVRTGETTQTALAAAAQASVQARYVMALQRPRNWDEARVRILAECKRPGFAEAARYRKPIGRGVEGPSIRFAEACLRHAGNLGVETTTTYEDRTKRILHVEATDFETNAHYSADLTIEKTVERSNAKDRVVVAERVNSAGNKVYIVEATEDELLNKIGAAVSKTARTLILRLIPGDIVDEGQDQCIATLRDRAAKDPASEKKKIVDAFASLGVMPNDLVLYLGHSLDAVQPAELVDLRQTFATIRDGETTWAAVIESRRGSKAEGEKPSPTQQASNIAEKVKARRAPKPAAAAAPQADADGVVPDDGRDDAAAEAALGEREPGDD